MPLGTTAHKQGRIAGLNAARGNYTFAGLRGTQAVKVFELVAARTGFRDSEAKAAGFDAHSVTVEVDDHKAYYPGSTKIIVRVTGDRRSAASSGYRASAPMAPRSRSGSTSSPPRSSPRCQRRESHRPRPELHPAAVGPLGPGAGRGPGLAARGVLTGTSAIGCSRRVRAPNEAAHETMRRRESTVVTARELSCPRTKPTLRSGTSGHRRANGGFKAEVVRCLT